MIFSIDFACAFYFIFRYRFNDTNMINIINTDKSIGRSINNNHKPSSFPFPLKNTIYSSFNEPSNHQPKIIYASSPVSRTWAQKFNCIYTAAAAIFFLRNVVCFKNCFFRFLEIAQDRFVPHETSAHFIEKNNRNRIKFSPSIKECKLWIQKCSYKSIKIIALFDYIILENFCVFFDL